jgi:hypothetical protein
MLYPLSVYSSFESEKVKNRALDKARFIDTRLTKKKKKKSGLFISDFAQ